MDVKDVVIGVGLACLFIIVTASVVCVIFWYTTPCVPTYKKLIV